MQEIIELSKEKWEKVMGHFQKELNNLRTNRAHIGLVEEVMVDYYGTPTPLKQLASIVIPEPRQLTIEPWDKASLKSIEETLSKRSEFSVQSDGRLLRVMLPPLTEETRKDVVKILHGKMEETKIGIRGIREETMKKLKQMKESGEISEDGYFKAQKDVQELVDEYNKKVKVIGEEKEKDIMTV